MNFTRKSCGISASGAARRLEGPPPGTDMNIWTREPWLDDPMPDYENLLID